MRIALLLALTILVYGNTLQNGFTMDDEMYILRNHQVTDLSPRMLLEPNQFSNVFRPATFATFALNWKLGGANAVGYHVFNLLLHAMVTLLLYLLLRTLMVSVPRAPTIAFVAALLFAVHPIHTEAVASITGRSELLAAGFLLAAWLLHLHDRPILVLVCFVLALLSKESAVVFVPLVLAGDYVRGNLKSLFRYSSIAGTAAGYLALFWKVQGGRFGEKSINFLDNPLAHLPAILRIPNALRIAWKYVGLQLYPAKLSCDYSYNAILLYANLRHTALAAVATGLVLALWIWALWKRKNEWFLAGTIYFAAFAITANLLVPTGTIMAERLIYLPSAGFCLLVALIWIRLKERQRNLAWAALAIVVVALAARTVVRNRDWRDNFTLYSAAVRVVPGSAKMRTDLGAEYMYRGQLDAARLEYQTALAIFPNDPGAVEWLGLLDARTGNDQEALQLLKTALALTPRSGINYEFVVVNLAVQLMKSGENDDALKLLNQVVVESPENVRAWSNRAVILYQRGEVERARNDALTALHLDPANTQARNLLVLLNAPARAPVAPQKEPFLLLPTPTK